MTKVTKGVIVYNILNNTIYFVFSIFKKCLTKFISKIVKNTAEISNSKKNVKKNKCISTPFKLVKKLFLIFKFQK